LINLSILFDCRLSPTEHAEELTGELKPSFGMKLSLLVAKAAGLLLLPRLGLSGAQVPGTLKT
jgi:hypothetical protein